MGHLDLFVPPPQARLPPHSPDCGTHTPVYSFPSGGRGEKSDCVRIYRDPIVTRQKASVSHPVVQRIVAGQGSLLYRDHGQRSALSFASRPRSTRAKEAKEKKVKAPRVATTPTSSREVLTTLDFRHDWAAGQEALTADRELWPARKAGSRWFSRTKEDSTKTWDAIRGSLAACSDNRNYIFEPSLDIGLFLTDDDESETPYVSPCHTPPSVRVTHSTIVAVDSRDSTCHGPTLHNLPVTSTGRVTGYRFGQTRNRLLST